MAARRRLSLSEMVTKTVNEKKTKREKVRVAEEDGWFEAKLKDREENFTFEVAPWQGQAEMTTKWRKSTSLLELFLSVYTFEFRADLLARVRNDHPKAFLHQRGRTRKATRLDLGDSHLLQVFAIRIVLMGCQKHALRNEPHKDFLIKRFKKVLHWFGEMIPDCAGMIGSDRARKFNAAVQFIPGTNEEWRPFKNFRKGIIQFGELAPADEKLYHADLLRSGMVKVVRSKPAHVGIWGYQMAGWLAGSLPVCVYLRIHKEIGALDETIRLATVVQDWANIVKKKSSGRGMYATIVMDTHYLSQEGKQILVNAKIPFIAAVDKKRFESITSIICDRIQKTGDHAYAIRAPDNANDPYQLCMSLWSPDHKIKERYIITNALKKVGNKRRKGHYPGTTFFCC